MPGSSRDAAAVATVTAVAAAVPQRDNGGVHDPMAGASNGGIGAGPQVVAFRVPSAVAARALQPSATESSMKAETSTKLGGSAAITKRKRRPSVNPQKMVRIGWDKHFEHLKMYIDEFGTAKVPLKVDTPKYPRLGNWVLHQRQAYRNEIKIANGYQPPRNPDRINAERIAKLDAVGFVWGTYKGSAAGRTGGTAGAAAAAAAAGGRRARKPRAKRLRRDEQGQGSRAGGGASANGALSNGMTAAEVARAHELSEAAVRSSRGTPRRIVSRANGGDVDDGDDDDDDDEDGDGDDDSSLQAGESPHSSSRVASSSKRDVRGRSKNAPMKRLGWDAHFNHLKDFIEEFGHANVKLGTDSDKYPRLGNWVLHQRQAYHNEVKRAEGLPLGRNPDRISAQRIAKLNAVGFPWGKRRTTMKWDHGFELLQRYIEETGSAQVPRNLDTDAYPNLGKWVVAQRNRYRFAKMPDDIVGQGNAHSFSRKGQRVPSAQDSERIAKLDGVGFDWGRWTPHWDERFASLKKYLRGNTRVNDELDTETYPKLGQWIKKQRENYRCAKLRELGLLPANNLRNLSSARIQKLESIRQWTWGPLPTEIEWPLCFKQLQEFVQKHGHANVQPLALEAGQGSRVDNVPAPEAAKSATDADESSAAGGAGARAESATASSRPLPRRKRFSMEDRAHQRLAKWVESQRRAYAFTKMAARGVVPPSSLSLTQQQIDQLEGLGFEWRTPKLNAWERCFMNLQAYVEEHGHADVPHDLDTEKYPRLGYWTTRQRQAWRVAQQGQRDRSNNSTRRTSKRPNENHATSVALDADKIQQLEALGFDWHEKVAWDKKFSLLRSFIEEHGHSNVPHRFSTEAYPGLGRWVDVQRKHFRKRDRLLKLRQKKRLAQRKSEAGAGAGGEGAASHHQEEGEEEEEEEEGGEEEEGEEEEEEARFEDELEKKSLISAFQIQMLEAVGFDWGARALTRWEKRYEELCAYKDEFGHLRIKTALYPQLAAWVNSQRRAYHYEQSLKSGDRQEHDNRSTRISEERIAKLNAIGFQWVLSKWARKKKAPLLKNESGSGPVASSTATATGPAASSHAAGGGTS